MFIGMYSVALGSCEDGCHSLQFVVLVHILLVYYVEWSKYLIHFELHLLKNCLVKASK